jgi:methyl-accepting chemotaxis protein
MFVLSSTYHKAESEKQKLQQSVRELSETVESLQAENNALNADAQEKANAASSPNSYEHMLAKCTLDSLSQIEGIRETVLSSFEQISKQTESVAEINELFDISSSSLSTISSSMTGLSSKMGGMTTNISGLSDKADHINKFVTTITSISDQTNLLALNAAIEAARAGDAGRGFSVVADEVRTLANETNKSASEVADLVSSIIVSTKGAVSSVEDIKEHNDTLSSSVDKLNDDYQLIVQYCQNMNTTIASSSHRSFIQTVKLDHIVWKSDVYAVIHGLSDKPVGEFADHRMCRLGKWCQSDGRQQYSDNTAFRDLDRPHAAVHSNGVDAMRLFAEGKKDEAIKSLVKMEDASREVMACLDGLVR